MAKRKRRRVRHLGLDPWSHGERSKVDLREIRRLQKLFRSKMTGTPDCVHAASILRSLSREEGAYWTDIHDSESRGVGGGPSYAMDKIFDKFVKKCVRSGRSP